MRNLAPPACYAPGTRFQITSTDGIATVRDAATGLTWQRESSPTPLAWSDAVTYCRSLPGGFRLPGVKELLTILLFSGTGVARLDSGLFPGPVDPEFWSSAPAADTPGSAHAVRFSDYGGLAPLDTPALRQARCVR